MGTQLESWNSKLYRVPGHQKLEFLTLTAPCQEKSVEAALCQAVVGRSRSVPK